MRVLVTGATGYIGSRLMELLQEKLDGAELVALTRKLPDYFSDWRDKYQIIEADITDLNCLKERINGNFDTIVHLASYNDIDTRRDPNQSLVVNGLGTRNMLEIARDLNTGQFIYFSTLQVYGKELSGEYTVDTPPESYDDYALTHLVGEEYCMMFSRQHGLNTMVLRPANIFGSPVHKEIDRWTLVPSTLCLLAFNEGRIVLRSSGRQNRDFVSLDYVCQCTIGLIKASSQGNRIFNISSESLISIIEIAKHVQEIGERVLGKPVELVVESDEPREHNTFFLKNNIAPPPSPESLKSDLVAEIEKIFKLLIENGGD